MRSLRASSWAGVVQRLARSTARWTRRRVQAEARG